jgi:acetolactate synthase-1/2/3 large subunit
VKYADLVAEWLQDEGYTHCFFVAGGNIMHLLDGVRRRLHCIPFVHEVEAGIAAEYFNEASGGAKAFVLVTAGPGLTNLVTALAGAYLESRELLVLGGQVKREDLASGGVRQRGIQEIDGLAIAEPVTVRAVRIEQPIPQYEFLDHVRAGFERRPGPVFLEVCLDAQGASVDRAELEQHDAVTNEVQATNDADAAAEVAARSIVEAVSRSSRPVLLIGGGVSRAAAAAVEHDLAVWGVPVMTTWNGADRLDAGHPLYFGRPNTWGQRSSNVLLQQADLVIALGTRLGLQQTGFNWQQFAPLAVVAQVDIDEAELNKGHPRVDLAFAVDADTVLTSLVRSAPPTIDEWVEFCREVRRLLPLEDPGNVTGPGYLDPFRFLGELSDLCRSDDVIIPCSSGGAFTVAMQTFLQKSGQLVVTDKGLASMGYGLGGAIGAALATGRRTVLLEGDGGFSQNLQELATVAWNDLPLKMFVFSNEGYASIRMTQRNYFEGGYLGCDTKTGLGFPNWPELFGAYGIPVLEVGDTGSSSEEFRTLFASEGPAAFVLRIDPEQTYFPKITSRVTASGSMESNPLHVMAPDLAPDVAEIALRYLIAAGGLDSG